MNEVAVEHRSGFRFVLSQPAFRLIWLAQIAAQLADKFLMFSLIILAYHLSGGSTPVAFTLLAYTVPAVLISGPAGVYADRHNRKRIMVGSNLVRAIFVLLIPVSALVPALRHDFLHLLVLTFLFAAVGQLFAPAEAAAIPSVLPRQALITANSMVMITMILSLVIGAPLAPLVSRVSIYLPYWVAAVLFILAGGMILLARIPRLTQRAAEAPDRGRGFFIEFKTGVDFLRRSPVLLLTFAQLSLAVLVIFMIFTLAPAYVTTVIGIAAEDSYVILVPAAVGVIGAALALGQFGRKMRKDRLLVISLVATGLTMFALAGIPALLRADPSLWHNIRTFAGGFALLLGIEFGSLMIPALTHLMESTADEVRGRIFALFFMVVNGATAIPVLAAAALSDTIGTNRVIGGLGLLLALSGIASARLAGRVYGRR